MTVAFDAYSEAVQGTGNLSWTHEVTVTGAAAKDASAYYKGAS